MNNQSTMILNERTGRYIYSHGNIGKHILKTQKNNIKYTVLQYKHIRKLVLSFLIYPTYEYFCKIKSEEYYNTINLKKLEILIYFIKKQYYY